MTLQFSAQTALQLALRNTDKSIQNDIKAKLNFGRYASVPNARVVLMDWTAAYQETTAQLSMANTGVVTLTNTAVTPTVTVPSDESLSAPVLTGLKPLGLEVFLISADPVDGQIRDGECTITLNKTGPAILAKSTLYSAGASSVSHFHWSSNQSALWNSLVISGIKQHGVRIVVMLVGQA